MFDYILKSLYNNYIGGKYEHKKTDTYSGDDALHKRF